MKHNKFLLKFLFLFIFRPNGQEIDLFFALPGGGFVVSSGCPLLQGEWPAYAQSLVHAPLSF
jgi:hypothetical protein